MLQSIAGLIDEFRPFIRSEGYKHTKAEQRRDLFQFFLERGYSVYGYEEAGPTLKGKALSLEDVQQAAHYDIFAVPAASGSVSWLIGKSLLPCGESLPTLYLEPNPQRFPLRRESVVARLP